MTRSRFAEARVNSKFRLMNDGELLKKKGMKEGQSLGNVLKILETEWVTNNFKISNERIDEIIQINLKTLVNQGFFYDLFLL